MTVQLDRVGITQRWPRLFDTRVQTGQSHPCQFERLAHCCTCQVFVVVKGLSKLFLRVGTSVDAEVSGGPKWQRHRHQRDVRRTLYRACVGSAAI